jgi:hypothetical protein
LTPGLKLSNHATARSHALLDAYAFDLSQKVCVPDGAAIFAISDALQADLFLQLCHGANAAVFDFPQRRGGKSSLPMLLASAQKFRRPQQAANMIGEKGAIVSTMGVLLAAIRPAISSTKEDRGG